MGMGIIYNFISTFRVSKAFPTNSFQFSSKKMKSWLLVWICVLHLGTTEGCDTEFSGFGIHLGSIQHFNSTSIELIQEVIDKLYFDLQLRYFRTSYEPYFSPTDGNYTLTCTHPSNCTWSWEGIMEVLSNRQKYAKSTFMASVWSPPFHLMDLETLRLLPEKELDFYYYLKNITKLIEEKYGIAIQRVSPVNEPENLWASWNHCNMDPSQLCRMVRDFNDPLVSLCPENSYFWLTEIYLKYKNYRAGIDCTAACKTVATHAYALNLNSSSSSYGLAYYDLQSYPNPFKHHYHQSHPIWMTEVSSTFSNAADDQMREGLDLATNIHNFLGITCVERYYFWLAFTTHPSGESLIWATTEEDELKLRFPKKYFIYNHFTNASHHVGPTANVQTCIESNLVEPPGTCLTFRSHNKNVTVFMNGGTNPMNLSSTTWCPCGLCCTTEASDLDCDPSNRNLLPPMSVCTCLGTCQVRRRRKRKGRPFLVSKTTSYTEIQFFLENILNI